MTIPMHQQLRAALDRVLDARDERERAHAKAEFHRLTQQAWGRVPQREPADWARLAAADKDEP